MALASAVPAEFPREQRLIRCSSLLVQFTAGAALHKKPTSWNFVFGESLLSSTLLEVSLWKGSDVETVSILE